jgi:DNA (cytosine-5)-methyltransferase 1
MPTPAVAHLRNHDEDLDAYQTRRQDFIDGKVKGMPGASLGVAIRMNQQGIEPLKSLPTPTVADTFTANLASSQQKEGSMHSVSLAQAVIRPDLMPTPTTQDAKNNGGPSQFERNTKPLNTQVLVESEWGKFEPAIRRWEQTLRLEAPAPTKPDGKENAHRLSSEFTEWMMGLEPGWITDCGLTRNEELKAAGNGVVPQQAELALRILLAQTDFINDLE